MDMRRATDREIDEEILTTLYLAEKYEMEEDELYRVVKHNLARKGLRI